VKKTEVTFRSSTLKTNADMVEAPTIKEQEASSAKNALISDSEIK